MRSIDWRYLGEDILEGRNVGIQVSLVGFDIEVFHVYGMGSHGERRNLIVVFKPFHVRASAEVYSAALFQQLQKLFVLGENSGQRLSEREHGAFKTL